MALMHHNELRVNALAPDDEDQMATLHEVGWRLGAHKDTDPDHPAHLGPIPGVLPEPEPVPKAVKAATKKATD